jgi:hypothetical protein
VRVHWQHCGCGSSGCGQWLTVSVAAANQLLSPAGAVKSVQNAKALSLGKVPRVGSATS